MPLTRRALAFSRYGDAAVQELIDLPIPDPLPRTVLIRVHASGINPVDWSERSGRSGHRLEQSCPAVMGREAAGEVLALGKDVTGFAIGDQVFGSTAQGHGSHTTHTLLNASQTTRRPPTVEAAKAAVLPVTAGTARDTLLTLDLAPRSALLIIGASGGVGTMLSQLARHAWLDCYGIASLETRDLVRNSGAHFLDRNAGSPEQLLKSRGLDRVDGIVDLAEVNLPKLLTLVPQPSRLISLADRNEALRLGGLSVTRDRSRSAYSELAQLVDETRLHPAITQRVSLSDASTAITELEHGPHIAKTVIDMTLDRVSLHHSNISYD